MRGSTARSKAAWAHFRTNDEMGGDSTGATYFPTKTRVGVWTMKNTRQRTITLLSIRASDSA